MKKIKINAEDGYCLSALHYHPQKQSCSRTIVISAATGIRKEYYRDFSNFMAKHGFRVVCFDYRGIGESLVGDIRESKATMAQWGDLDVSAVLDWINHHYADDKVFYVGHSIGAHILGLAKHTEKISGTILISSGCAYWKNYGYFSKKVMWFFYFLIFPICLKILKYFPSKFFGLGDNLPPRIGENWSRWGRQEQYIYSDFPSAKEGIGRLQVPVLAYSFKDDWLASPRAVKQLLDIYPNFAKQWNHLSPKDIKLRSIGHNGFFKKNVEKTLWRDTLNWLDGIQ